MMLATVTIASAMVRRIEELQRGFRDDLDRYESAALRYLVMLGVEDLETVISLTGPDKYRIWAAESMVWTLRRIRAGEYKEALRGWGQVREYRGHCGGFLPSQLADGAIAIQNLLEKAIVR